SRGGGGCVFGLFFLRRTLGAVGRKGGRRRGFSRASDGVAGPGGRRGAEPRLDQRYRIQPVRHAAGKIAGDVDALRQAIDPCRLVIGEAVWSQRTPQPLAEQRLPRHDTADHPWRTREAQRGYEPFGWTLELRALGRP